MIDKNEILYNFFNDNLNHIFNGSTDTYKYYNNIKLYKRGSKIQIKKSNRGKFTEYCGGLHKLRYVAYPDDRIILYKFT